MIHSPKLICAGLVALKYPMLEDLNMFLAAQRIKGGGSRMRKPGPQTNYIFT